MKISGFLVTMIIIGMFVTVLGSFYAGIANEYPVTYDNATARNISGLNKLAEIQNTTDDIEAQLFDEQEATGISDLVGKFLGAGFNVLKVAKNSISAFYDMADEALTGIPGLGNSLFVFKGALVLVVAVMVFFIIISTLVGRDV